MSQGEGNNSQTKFNFMRVIPGKSNYHVNIDSKRIIDNDTKRILFEGDRVFYRDSQSDIMHTLLTGVVEEFFKGCSSLILAYGGRGCGKSFTCFGIHGDFEDRGLAINLIEQLFQIKASLLHKADVSLELSFIEFREKCTIDLLTNKIVILTQRKMTKISSLNAAILLLLAGCLNRVTRRIKNYNSHCYTAVLTIRMYYRSLIIREPVVIRCQIQIVDLATVEHNNKCDLDNSMSTHKQVIGNVSIMNILRVVESLKNQNKFYCISPLISHLKETLGVHSLIKVIGHSKENLPMLRSISKISKKFSRIPQSILKYGVEYEKNLRLQVLKEQVKLLTKQCRQNDMVREHETELNMNDERVEQINRLNTEFLKNHISDYEVLSVAQMRPALTMLKTIINQYEDENYSLLASINAAQINEMTALDKLAEKNYKNRSKLSKTKALQHDQVIPNQPIILVGQEMRGCGITIGNEESQILSESFRKTISVQKKIARKRKYSQSDALSKSHFFREEETIQTLVKKAHSECLDTFGNLKQSQTELDMLRNRIATTQNIILTKETWENDFIRKIKLHELNKCNENTNSLHSEVIHQIQCKNSNFIDKIHNVSVPNHPVMKHSKSYVKVFKTPSIKNAEVCKIKDELKEQYSSLQKIYLTGRRK